LSKYSSIHLYDYQKSVNEVNVTDVIVCDEVVTRDSDDVGAGTGVEDGADERPPTEQQDEKVCELSSMHCTTTLKIS
jgi:hypothetical protein